MCRGSAGCAGAGAACICHPESLNLLKQGIGGQYSVINGSNTRGKGINRETFIDQFVQIIDFFPGLVVGGYWRCCRLLLEKAPEPIIIIGSGCLPYASLS